MSVGTGYTQSCALLNNGTVYCWGANNVSQVGTGTRGGRTLNPTTPVLGVTTASALAVGEGHACVVQKGAVLCWGNGGSLGNGAAAEPADHAVPALGLEAGWKDVESGDGTCVLGDNGSVRCWRLHGVGESGTSELVKGLSDVTAVAPGKSHACAVTASKKVMCFGENGSGQVGTGKSSSTPITTATEVAGLPPSISATAGYSHSCAVAEDGRVFCWGAGARGELGNGGKASSLVPVEVAGLPGPAASVEAGYATTCAVLRSGEIWCWGINDYGVLGSGSTDPTLVPVKVVLEAAATRVSVGYGHACAIVAPGRVFCWGDNRMGQLGNGSVQPSARPVEIAPPGPSPDGK